MNADRVLGGLFKESTFFEAVSQTVTVFVAIHCFNLEFWYSVGEDGKKRSVANSDLNLKDY